MPFITDVTPWYFSPQTLFSSLLSSVLLQSVSPVNQAYTTHLNQTAAAFLFFWAMKHNDHIWSTDLLY